MNGDRNGQIFSAGVALSVALVLSSVVGAWAFTRAKASDQTVTVTGSARKRIKSDLIVWRANVTYQSEEMGEAYSALKERVPRVRSYLISKGVPENEIVVSAVSTQALHESSSEGEGGGDEGRITGYRLSQTLEVRSMDVDKITTISREVTELIEQGIFLESTAPEYHYTKLGDLKIQMLAEAAKDAKLRAQQIASSTGSSVGDVRSARMGVLQITPADSNAVSDYGMNDTTALEKDITAVVNVSFAVD